MFAAAPESHGGAARHRPGCGRDRAARHPRPQRRNPGDRRARALAVRASRTGSSTSTRRRAAHRGDARSRRRRSCASGSRRKRGFVWLKREITPKQREQIHRLGLPGIGFLPENKRVYPERRRGLPPDRSRQHRQPGHRRHREMARRAAGSPTCIWPGLPPTACRSRSSSRSICACSTRCATS